MFMREVDNVNKIYELKDDASVHKQMAAQKKINNHHSQLISTKLNKISTINNTKNVHYMKELDFQAKQENYYKVNLKNNDRTLEFQRWASVEKDRQRQE